MNKVTRTSTPIPFPNLPHPSGSRHVFYDEEYNDDQVFYRPQDIREGRPHPPGPHPNLMLSCTDAQGPEESGGRAPSPPADTSRVP